MVRGRVQGVSFRWYASEEAERLGVSGWVANRSDGAVELEAEGSEPQLEELLAWLRHGPSAAHVSDVEVTWSDPTGERGRFRIRRDL